MNASTSNITYEQLIAYKRFDFVPIIGYSALGVVGFFTNLLSLLIIGALAADRRMLLETLLYNLCFSDLLISLLTMPTKCIWRITVAWKGGAVLCGLVNWLVVIGPYASGLFVAAIAFERMKILDKNYNIVRSKKRQKRIVCAIWIISVLGGMPQAFVFRLVRHPEVAEFEHCRSEIGVKSLESAYHLGSLFLLHLLPFLIIVLSYGRICYKVCEMKRGAGGEKEKDESGEESRMDSSTNGVSYSMSTLDSRNASHAASQLSNVTRETTRGLLNENEEPLSVSLKRAQRSCYLQSITLVMFFLLARTPYCLIVLYDVIVVGIENVHHSGWVDELLALSVVICAVLNPVIYRTCWVSSNRLDA